MKRTQSSGRSVLRWYALRVTYCRELALKKALEAEGVECFLPMRHVEQEADGQSRRLRVPAVHNLLFARTTLATLAAFRKRQGAACPLRFILDCTTGEPLTLDDETMRHFIAVAGTYEEQLLYLPADEARLQAGDRVRITGGIWAGVEGHLLRVKGDCRVVVEIRGFMAVATAALHPSLVEKIPEKK